jgi:hypothetical protein
VFIEQGVRREAMLGVIEGARQRLVLSLFRCRSLPGDPFRITEIVRSVSVIGTAKRNFELPQVTSQSPPGNWQITYELAAPKRLLKGTKVEVVAHFDNSTANKYNPDPTKDVTWGDQTWEEMMIGFWGSVVDRPVASQREQ